MTTQPTFTWDEAKAKSNLAKHLIPMEAGAAVFEDPFHLVEDDAFARNEHRFVAIGLVDGIVLTVVF